MKFYIRKAETSVIRIHKLSTQTSTHLHAFGGEQNSKQIIHDLGPFGFEKSTKQNTEKIFFVQNMTPQLA